VAGVAAVVHSKGGKIERAAIGVTGVAPHAYRASAIESALAGRSIDDIATSCEHAADVPDALSDNFASAEYRKHMAAVYCERAVREAAKRKK
jgi:carbon-monoxide dehydrogenase medium subunit